MAKNIAETSNALSIFWLKKKGYLKKDTEYQGGTITWTYCGEASSIGFYIRIDNLNTPDERAYVNLNYTHTSRQSGEQTKIDYMVQLTTTSCNYSGKRYWFICPLETNGLACGRRVGVLYRVGKYFGCRYCMRIAYQSQMYGGMNKGFVSCPDIEQAESEVKRWHYRGKPTRKYRRVIRLNEKFDKGFMAMAMKLTR